ncbi:transporter substrate-binding domain-containing protein [Azohydromonas caseinilytica]|uniref:Transporter substrate-binding domain-containing protein n=1 Tax=Azohydromonas caseinilytica TaxID=2728836 RepID=A0A848FH12_9BURK|nr:transporter substrate-binding domain-containing protein [Azohydromonas caseinilytica]NML18758.1 transporter substrate-binding domain-containing protein [Azohydromonas caseinilytica]
MSFRSRLGLLLLGLLLGAAVRAQDMDTLERIAQTGTISLGHREGSVPFSYYDDRKQVVGYSHELMLRVLDAIKAELKLPALTIRLVPVTTQNRIPLVQNGTVDLECAATSHTVERERLVSFSHSIFVVGLRLLVHKDSGIRDFADLAGRTVAVTGGTTSERLLHTYNERHGRRLQIRVTRDQSATFRLLQEGKADAVMHDDALLYGERAKAPRPEDWIVVGTPMASEVYGCMLRRGDTAFKQVVDRALERLMHSGEARQIYTRWFQRPIPPKGLNLGWPPSEALLELYRHPNDRPLG